MFHPVGSQPPAVYWRRRLVLFAAVVILLVLFVMTIKALASDGSKPAAAHTTPPGPTTSAPAPQTTSTSSSASSTAPSVSTSQAAATTATSPAASTTGTVAVAACAPNQLSIAADPGKPVWNVGEQPALALQVTNTGTAPCVQDVSDSQIELRVYNGASRVWGSHDCQVEPGTVKRTLLPGAPAGFTVTWSGMSSQPKCAGTRQRVGAGTYTLYASLAGRNGKAATFRLK